MKVGLCVRYDCNNYGSMLQIFATQKAIQKLNCDYEIIRYDKKNLKFLVTNVTRVFNPYFMRGKMTGISKKWKMKANPAVKVGNDKRMKAFAAYRKEFIKPYSPVFKGYDNLVRGAKNYDAVVVGSDQLWTPAGIKSKFYNLLFVPDDVKKISFATSFGVGSIPESQKKMTAEYLSRIDYLSVRERKGAEIVRELTGREAVVALDPTLLFNGEEWKEFFPEKRLVEDKYIVAFFLGSSPDHRQKVKELAEKTGLKIVTFPHLEDVQKADMNFGDEEMYGTAPYDFLNLIRGAEYICTDSFHATVFSILNHKKFLIFNRFSDTSKHSKNSRIESLCDMLNLNGRRYDQHTIDNIFAEIDYTEVDRILDEERKKTFDFLQKAFYGDEKP